jgi:hypothetical protein
MLHRGHALHFRLHDPASAGVRLDVMSVMRAVAPFEALWERRTTAQIGDGAPWHVIALPDLVDAKKTQRDKDWPMIRRLVEAHYAAHREAALPEQLTFWFLQARTPAILVELCARFPDLARGPAARRRLLLAALDGDADGVAAGLRSEEEAEREADRVYWAPLRAELERLRRSQRRDCSV